MDRGSVSRSRIRPGNDDDHGPPAAIRTTDENHSWPCNYPTKRSRTSTRACWCPQWMKTGRRRPSCGAAFPAAEPAQRPGAAADAGAAARWPPNARLEQGAAGDAAARRRLHRFAAETRSTTIRRKGDASDAGPHHEPRRTRSARAGRPRRHPRHRRLVPGGAAALRGPAQQLSQRAAARDAPGAPRIYFEGNNVDNDALQELLDLLQITCVDPEQREERWGVIVISKSGGTLETAVALPDLPARGGRVLRPALATAAGADRADHRADTGSCANLCQADGYTDEDILTIPDDVGGRFRVLTPVGLLPAAVMGLDVRAMLLGAAAMTRRFLEEPFEHNPVLQYAAVNYLMATQCTSRSASCRSGRRSSKRWACGTISCSAESLGKHGPRPDAVDDGADARSALARPAASGRGARQDHQQPRREELPAADHDRHGGPQRGRAEPVQPQGPARPDERGPARHQPRRTSTRPGRPPTSCCRRCPSTRWGSSCRC